MDGEQDTKEIERRFASQAIEQARLSSDNPRVGAIISRGENVLASGFKGERPSFHAEQMALEKARESNIDIKGSELYTTLERTPITKAAKPMTPSPTRTLLVTFFPSSLTSSVYGKD